MKLNYLLVMPRFITNTDLGYFFPLGLPYVSASMKKAGLNGMEIYYPEHTREQTKLYRAIAREGELILTGGTDFHTPERGASLGDCGVGEDNLKIILNQLNY